MGHRRTRLQRTCVHVFNICCVFTCLCRGHESRVALVVLPVHIQVRTLGKGDDHIHVTMVTRHNQARLEEKSKALCFREVCVNVSLEPSSAVQFRLNRSSWSTVPTGSREMGRSRLGGPSGPALVVDSHRYGSMSCTMSAGVMCRSVTP